MADVIKHAQSTFVFLICLTLSGCTIQRIVPVSASLAVRESVRGDELRHLALAIEDNNDASSRRPEINAFVEGLRRAQLFKSVAFFNGEKTTVDLLISQFRYEHEAPSIPQGFQCFEPYLMVVTMGIIPSVCRSKHVLSFRLSATRRADSLEVQEAFSWQSVTGWAALPLNASTRWGRQGDFDGFLVLIFLSRLQEILRITSSNQSLQTDR
jgi:hypothetical protein